MKKIFIIIILSAFSIKIFAYDLGDNLCGKVKWKQGTNNVGGCSPSYNYYMPSGKEGDYCYKKPVGCAAVAVGTVMYRWKFPVESVYGVYNWNNINEKLMEDSPDDLPRLFRDIGSAVNMSYHDNGSWATVTNVKEGLDEFGYSAEILKKKDWDSYGTAWEDLVRTEIECGRPVIMYGMKSSVIDFTHSHFFVIDGYSETDSQFFYIKYGWGSSDDNYYKLDETLYKYHNEIIAGISPKKEGRQIDCKQLNNAISPSCVDSDRIKVWFSVECADSYHCQVFDRDGKQIWASAGLIIGEKVSVWDGSSLSRLEMTDYWLSVTFKNSLGGVKTVSTNVTYYPVSDANVQVMNKYVSPKCPEDENSCLSFSTRYVERWAGGVYDRNGKKLWDGSGTVENGVVVTWCGRTNSGSNLLYDTYYYSFTFYDVCGKSLVLEKSADLNNFLCFNESSGVVDVVSQSDWEYNDSDIYNLGSSFVSHISSFENYASLPDGIYLVVKKDESGTLRRKLIRKIH